MGRRVNRGRSGWGSTRERTALLGVLAAALLTPAPAAAALPEDLFAAPSALGSGDCSSPANACTAGDALAQAIDGDSVILAPGDYAGIGLSQAVTLRGTAGQPRPRILASSGATVQVNAAATVRDLDIEQTGSGVATNGILVTQDGATIERVSVESSGQTACAFQDSTGTIRDSVCWNTAADSNAFALISVSNDSGFDSVSARNVTAIAPEAVAVKSLDAAGAGSSVIFATNVIARGLPDVNAQAGSGAAKVNIDHSNFGSGEEVGAGEFNEGAGNQTGAPLFADGAVGDFHQLLGSPTIDNGIGGAGLGSLDLDGQARTFGALPDIGADEFHPVVPEPPAEPPATPPSKKKKCKKKRKKRAAPAAKKCKRKKRK